MEFSNFFMSAEDFDSVSHHEKILSEMVGTGAKVDHIFGVIRYALKKGDKAYARTFITMADKEMSKGGDWERKNKLSVYKGVLCLLDRNLNTAAELFVKALATFTPCDLLSFKDFVFYTVITSIISFDRATIMNKILQSPEILAVVGEISGLRELVTALYECRYRDFFSDFIGVIDFIRNDPYLSIHLRYITRAIRLVSYKQFLMPYKSVTIDMMASVFGVTPEFIESELCGFIVANKLHCKIDRINKVVETNRLEDSRNVLYSRVVKNGDLLLNRLQKLSRVIDV